MVTAFIIGTLTGAGLAIWLCHLFMDRYFDYRVESMFPNEIDFTLCDKSKESEIPEIVKAIKKIKSEHVELN